MAVSKMKTNLVLFIIGLLGLVRLSNSLGAITKSLPLSENDWHQILQGEWMVEFYAPWCPACKSLQPVWEDFATWGKDLQIQVAKVDVTTAPGLSGRFMVTALPTIFHVHNGEFRQYRGGRDKDSLISFVDEKKWKEIEPIPSWKSPGSVIMSIVSLFFKLSTHLRSFHNTLVDDYGIPTWGSYAVFGISMIVLGALLGLILVCVIDCVYHPKTLRQSPLAPVEETEEGDDMEDLIDEGAESSDEREEVADTPSEEDCDGSQRDELELEATAESSPTMRKRKPRKAD